MRDAPAGMCHVTLHSLLLCSDGTNVIICINVGIFCARMPYHMFGSWSAAAAAMPVQPGGPAAHLQRLPLALRLPACHARCPLPPSTHSCLHPLPACVAPTQDIPHSQLRLTPVAEGYLAAGSAEAQLFGALPPEGMTLEAIKVGGGGDWCLVCTAFIGMSAGYRSRACCWRWSRSPSGTKASRPPWPPCPPPWPLTRPLVCNTAMPCPHRTEPPPSQPGPSSLVCVQASLPADVASGFNTAMANKWIALDKSGGAPLVVGGPARAAGCSRGRGGWCEAGCGLRRAPMLAVQLAGGG